MIFAVTCCVVPLVALFDEWTPKVTPFGIQIFVGSFVFGIGMQIANTCASGCMVFLGKIFHTVLPIMVGAGFMGGAVMGWYRRPGWERISGWTTAPEKKGYGSSPVRPADGIWWQEGVCIQFCLVIGIWFVFYMIEKNAHGKDSVLNERVPPLPKINQGKGTTWTDKVFFHVHPWWVGGLGVSIGTGLVFLFNKAVWGVAFPFALVGSKILYQIGSEDSGLYRVAKWDMWTKPKFANMLKNQELYNNGNVMVNCGLILGAMVAYFLTQRYEKPITSKFMHRPVTMLGAFLGGGMMGYGALIAYGCNIGGYFSTATSLSMGSWLWLAGGLAGSYFGVKLRPFFGLKNETCQMNKGAKWIPIETEAEVEQVFVNEIVGVEEVVVETSLNEKEIELPPVNEAEDSIIEE